METGAQRQREPDAAQTNSKAPFGGEPESGVSASFIRGAANSLFTSSGVTASEHSLVELSPHGQLPRLDLGIEWTPSRREFWSSVRHFFSGQRAPKDSELPADSDLRIHWIRGRHSGWAFVASSAWHIALVLLAVLPIWGFLPATARDLAPVQIEVDWNPAQDLPQINLPAPRPAAAAPKRSLTSTPKVADNQPPPQDGADAFHPRQTILSIPVRVTHPTQTLIQPAAPMTPPKIEAELPNIVQWGSSAALPKPQLQLSASAAAPRMRQRQLNDSAAPEVTNLEKNAGPLNIASTPVVNPAPQMPMAPMAAAVAQARRTRNDSNSAAPSIDTAGGDASLRNVIALSGSPAPPAPVVEVPEGNSAARVAISPSGRRPGSPGGTGSSETDTNGGEGGGNGGVSTGGAGLPGATSLPAAVRVTGGNSHAAAAGGGGSTAGQSRTRLMLRPMSSPPEKPQPANPRKGPPNFAELGPNEAPEKVLTGKEVYTLDVNLPNVTSISGSWILNFAQLDEDATPFNKPRGTLSGPVPIRKVDPKYPPDVMKENVEGEVVLYAIIRADGSVDDIQLVRKLDPRLDTNAVAALAQWKFRPAMRQGEPVDVEAVVHIPFKYRLPPQ